VVRDVGIVAKCVSVWRVYQQGYGRKECPVFERGLSLPFLQTTYGFFSPFRRLLVNQCCAELLLPCQWTKRRIGRPDCNYFETQQETSTLNTKEKAFLKISQMERGLETKWPKKKESKSRLNQTAISHYPERSQELLRQL